MTQPLTGIGRGVANSAKGCPTTPGSWMPSYHPRPGSGVYRPLAEVLEGPPQVAGRVADDELAMACFDVACSVPAVLEVHHRLVAERRDLVADQRDVGDLELEVDPTSVRMVERCRTERLPGPSARSIMRWGALAFEVHEPFARPRVHDNEPENSLVEAQ